MAWSKGQHVPRPGQPAAHRRRRQPRSSPTLPARGDPNPDHLFGADGGGQCPGRAGGRTRKKVRTDGAAQPTAQPTPLLALAAQPAPLLALAEGRAEAAVVSVLALAL